MKTDWKGKRSTEGGRKSGKWRELSKQRCLPKDHCSCTKSGAVRPTLSEAVSERGKGAEEKKKWFEELISSLWTSRDGNPGSLSVSRSNFTQKKCLQITGLNLLLYSSEENVQNKSYPVGSWKVKPHTGRLHIQLSWCPLRKSPSVLPRTCLILVNVFSACAPTAQQLNTLMVDAKGRNMKCLTFFLMLPESVKSKSSKSTKKGNASGSSKLPPVCYEIITLRSKKKKKMAADIFPTKKTASTTTVQQYQQQNLNNNNTIQNCNWQGLYSTIRER